MVIRKDNMLTNKEQNLINDIINYIDDNISFEYDCEAGGPKVFRINHNLDYKNNYNQGIILSYQLNLLIEKPRMYLRKNEKIDLQKIKNQLKNIIDQYIIKLNIESE